jgi:hypothetical protein
MFNCPWRAGVAAMALAMTLPAAAGTADVAPGDVMLRADGVQSFRDAQWWVHCDGVRGDAVKLDAAGVRGLAARGEGTAQKFGKVPSPSGAGAPVLLFRAQANNAKHGGSPRCELAFREPDESLPRNQVFWHAFSLWLDDWSQAADMIAVTQWFHAMVGAGLNPPFVMVARGERLYGQVRHSQYTGKMTKADQTGERIFEVDGGIYKRWLNFVIQAKVSPDPADKGFMKVWLNGKPIADYRGPIGYAMPGAREIVVHGNYPLVKGNLPFDKSVPVRDMFLGKAVVVKDPGGRFAEPDLRRVLESAQERAR